VITSAVISRMEPTIQSSESGVWLHWGCQARQRPHCAETAHCLSVRTRLSSSGVAVLLGQGLKSLSPRGASQDCLPRVAGPTSGTRLGACPGRTHSRASASCDPCSNACPGRSHSPAFPKSGLIKLPEIRIEIPAFSGRAATQDAEGCQ